MMVGTRRSGALFFNTG